MLKIIDIKVQELANLGNVGVFKDIVIYLVAFIKLSIIHWYIIAKAIAVFVEKEI